VLVITLLLLTFMGDALRDALDPRKQAHTGAAKRRRQAMSQENMGLRAAASC
jgi:hypothetical protein